MKLLKIEEVANKLSVQPSTVRKWIFERRISIVRLGRCVRVKEMDVERFIESGYRRSND